MRDEMSAYYYYYYYYYYEVHAVRSSSVRPVYGHIRRNTYFSRRLFNSNNFAELFALAEVCALLSAILVFKNTLILWQRDSQAVNRQ